MSKRRKMNQWLGKWRKWRDSRNVYESNSDDDWENLMRPRILRSESADSVFSAVSSRRPSAAVRESDLGGTPHWLNHLFVTETESDRSDSEDDDDDEEGSSGGGEESEEDETRETRACRRSRRRRSSASRKSSRSLPPAPAHPYSGKKVKAIKTWFPKLVMYGDNKMEMAFRAATQKGEPKIDPGFMTFPPTAYQLVNCSGKWIKRKQNPHTVLANYSLEDPPGDFYPLLVRSHSVSSIPIMTSEDINVELFGNPEGREKQRSYHKDLYHYMKIHNPGKLRRHRDKMKMLYREARDERRHESIRLQLENERREREQRLAAGYSGNIPECSTSSRGRGGRSHSCSSRIGGGPHSKGGDPRPGTSRGPIEDDEND